MTRNQEILLAVAIALAAIVVAVALTMIKGRALTPITLVGSVLRQDSDTRKQTPLAGVTVTAASGSIMVNGKSDTVGFFSLILRPEVKKRQAVVLSFELAGYKVLKINTTTSGDQLYVARLQPLQPEPENEPAVPAKTVEIKNIRVRYSFKGQSTVSVGSLAKQFTVPNKGNVPCRDQKPCSPDGRWKATETALPLDAEEGNEFRDVRVSCIAGPCAFTKIKAETFARPARKITVSVLNWSDTTDFLVEADVTRTMEANQVRHSFPFIVGQAMNFALAPGSEGPSVEADLDGQHVVFPLGPALILSWAACSIETSPDANRIYRCQLKPGYRFQQ